MFHTSQIEVEVKSMQEASDFFKCLGEIEHLVTLVAPENRKQPLLHVSDARD